MNREDEIQKQVEEFGIIECPRCNSICRVMQHGDSIDRVYVLCYCCGEFGPAKKTVRDAVRTFVECCELIDNAYAAHVNLTMRRALLINARRDHMGAGLIAACENDVRDAIVSESLARRAVRNFISEESAS